MGTMRSVLIVTSRGGLFQQAASQAGYSVFEWRLRSPNRVDENVISDNNKISIYILAWDK